MRTEVERTGNATALAQAIRHWTKCRGDNRLNSIRAFRDKQIAHWGQMKTQGPIINDIFAMSRETATAIELLAQGTGVVSFAPDRYDWRGTSHKLGESPQVLRDRRQRRCGVSYLPQKRSALSL